jgi:hypothetical protein
MSHIEFPWTCQYPEVWTFVTLWKRSQATQFAYCWPTPNYSHGLTTVRSSSPNIVCIATGYLLDNRRVGVRVPVGSRIFSSPYRLGPSQPPIQWLRGVKRQGREADHWPPTSTEAKKMWIYTATPPYAFMAQCLMTRGYAKRQVYLFTPVLNDSWLCKETSLPLHTRP